MKNKSIYQQGHRQRVRTTFINAETEQSSDETILEMTLFMLYPRIDTEPLVKKILHNFGTLRKFSLATIESICETFNKDKKYPPCSQKTIENVYFVAKLIRETHMRLLKQPLYEEGSTILNTWSETIEYLKHKFGHLTQEHFSAVFLSAANKIIEIVTLNTGTIDEVSVHNREIIKKGTNNGAVSIILVHNHFSGNVEPSIEDKELTHRLVMSCRGLNLEVIDHIIVSADNYYSFRENHLIM